MRGWQRAMSCWSLALATPRWRRLFADGQPFVGRGVKGTCGIKQINYVCKAESVSSGYSAESEGDGVVVVVVVVVAVVVVVGIQMCR